MNERAPGSQAPGMNLEDVLYVLCRHKWKIVLLSCAAVLVTLGVKLVLPPTYQSQARLYIRYVVDTKTPTLAGDNDTRVRSPNLQGDSILQTEKQILTSMDLAEDVADAIGPDKLLGRAVVAGRPDLNRLRAAALIQKHLLAEVPQDTSVVQLTFQDSNPEIVQAVLKQLIASYFKKHAEIRAVGAFDEFLTQETDNRRAGIAQTEEELRKAKAKAGIVSLVDTEEAYGQQIARLQQAILDTEAELSQRRASANQMAQALNEPSVVTNGMPATNHVEQAPPEKVEAYGQVCSLIDSLSRKERELLSTYAPSSSLVQYVREQIQTQERAKRAMEKECPGLIAVSVSRGSAGSGQPEADARGALGIEFAQVSGLESKLKTLRGQLNEVQGKAAALSQQSATIMDLQRRLALQETNYARFSQSLEQSRLDEKLGAGKVSNISTIEEPTPALPAPSKLMKILAMVLLGGLGVAFGLPFVWELYVDRSIKRPAEVESRIRLPLFLSIPLLNGRGRGNALAGPPQRLLSAGGDSAGAGASAAEVPALAANGRGSNGALLPWEPAHPLHAFWGALRDRLITYFEVKEMTHKPKLVAVTSCGEGAGVSTIAAGLAASLSETGDGNVLLVDMNLANGGAAHFHQGGLACGLDEALEAGTREQALVQDKLYMVSEAGNHDKLPAALPKRFRNLVPRLKASDYDYIIFDLPPVNQISLTPRLARFMDMVLMVVESEKTDQDAVKRAAALLNGPGANLGVVLNKWHQYVPGKRDV
jgi:uncharacterized protein involved in exopolysaccharide biosynthesis/Mrp family chromosome partitioning ATPase